MSVNSTNRIGRERRTLASTVNPLIRDRCGSLPLTGILHDTAMAYPQFQRSRTKKHGR